jgi:hypothetical protein
MKDRLDADFLQDGWKHKRIDAELAKAYELSEKRKVAVNARRPKVTSPSASITALSTGSAATASRMRVKASKARRDMSLPCELVGDNDDSWNCIT